MNWPEAFFLTALISLVLAPMWLPAITFIVLVIFGKK